MRVLLVEDDSATAASIEMMLRAENFIVDTTDLGEDGLEIGKLYDYDIIILDLMLPDIDGYEVCRNLKLNPATKNIGVLMLTAKGGVDDPTKEAWKFAGRVNDRLRGFDSGALEFLTKPVKAKDLVQRVKAVLWASGIL